MEATLPCGTSAALYSGSWDRCLSNHTTCWQWIGPGSCLSVDVATLGMSTGYMYASSFKTCRTEQGRETRQGQYQHDLERNRVQYNETQSRCRLRSARDKKGMTMVDIHISIDMLLHTVPLSKGFLSILISSHLSKREDLQCM